MKHIAYFSRAGMIVTVIFLAANYLAYIPLKAFISDSKFRAVVAANASEYVSSSEPVTLFIGNSRIMGGIDSIAFNAGKEGKESYNLAYNGLYLDDLEMLLRAFMQSCRCDVEYVLAHPDIFQELTDADQTASPLQKFLAAFDLDASQDLEKTDTAYGVAMEFFPLLHFNNEFFLRALYYKLLGKDDQSHGNNYRFVVTSEVEQRLADMPPTPRLKMDVIDELRARLAGTGTSLVIIQPPYHKAYIDHVPGFQDAHDDMAKILAERGVEYFDHSRLFYDRPDFFSDPVHLNREGQQRYSKYLQGVMGSGGGG